MAYTSWSVIFGEQPSASKWNILGTNDDFFNTQIGANFSSGTTSTIWYEELGRTTLSTTADTIAVSSFAARKYLRILFIAIHSSSVRSAIQFNSDSGTNYSHAMAENGGAVGTAVSQTQTLLTAGATTNGDWVVLDGLNISNKEKVFRLTGGNWGATGGANAPGNIREGLLKWANTSAQITTVTINNTSTGDFAAGTELVILGHD